MPVTAPAANAVVKGSAGRSPPPPPPPLLACTTGVVETRVTVSSDDAEQTSGAAPVLNSTDLGLVTDAAVQTVGMRFTGVTVPRGATVTKAYIQFTTDETGAAQRTTPGLSAVVREVTNRSGWASGNALAVIVSGSGKRVARAFDAQLGSAPLLHVEYQIDRTAPSSRRGRPAPTAPTTAARRVAAPRRPSW